MSNEKTPGLDDVANLMLERQRYESWLASLDARKAATPEAVFQRVRGDYATRLKAVTDALIARRASLQSHAEMLDARLTQLESDAQRVREVRAESELRMQVGELAVAEWNVKSQELDERMTRLTEAQAQVRVQLAQAREIVAMVASQSEGGGVPTPPSVRKPTPARASRPVSAEQVRAAEGSNSGATPAVKGGARSPVNELEFLNSVVGAQSAERAKRNAPPAPVRIGDDGKRTPNALPAQPKPAAEEEAPDLASSLLSRMSENNGAGTLREDADAESLLNRKPAAKPAKTRSGKVPAAPAASSPAGPPSSPSNPAVPKVQPLAANVTENNPIVLKPQGNLERHKTLKCAECATMNYPTEWYCERCGAELSAI